MNLLCILTDKRYVIDGENVPIRIVVTKKELPKFPTEGSCVQIRGSVYRVTMVMNVFEDYIVDGKNIDYLIRMTLE